MTVRVKICGIKTIDTAMSVIDSGGDYIGINFSPVSKRSVDLKKGMEVFESIKKGAIILFWLLDCFIKIPKLK